MKKTGFTLAEVLITLTIIGVVATMTLPALMNNVQDQQAKTALKKGLNTLTEAVGQQFADQNWDFNALPNGTADNRQTLSELLAERAEMDYDRSYLPAEYGASGKAAAGDVAAVEANSKSGTGNNYVVFLKDGSAFSFPADMTYLDAAHKAIGVDRNIFGVPIKYDINGAKAPNELSNCLGKAKNDDGNVTTEKAEGEAAAAACTKANRYIRDQFSIRLRGKFAIPNGPAARWAADQDVAKTN